MPRNKGKNRGKKKKNKNQRATSETQPVVEEDEMPTRTFTRSALMEKWNVRLGPPGYEPGPSGLPKSVHISNFTMMDPGGGRELLSRTEIHIGEGSIYGFVGRNGYGKSTLLRLMNYYEIEEFPRHIRMCLVRQEEVVNEYTVLESVLKADDIRERVLAETDRLEELSGSLEDEGELEEIGMLLDIVYNMHGELNYDISERKAMQILAGLGFTSEMTHQRITDLSGGWQMRCKLAQALFVQPDLMLLDEPTNHLDFPTVLWLQEYLATYKRETGKTVVVVSHDRTFLNAVCDHIILLNFQKLKNYRGNFDTMLKTKEMEEKQQVHDYEATTREIQELTDYCRTFRDRGEKQQAQIQSKLKILKKLEVKAEELKPEQEEKDLVIVFPDVGELDDYVCRMEDVSFKYPTMENMLLTGITLRLDMDSRVGMLGANGVGKTTLVQLIMGDLDPLEGDCLRNRSARIARFTQHHMDSLDLEKSAVEHLCDVFEHDPEMEKRKGKIQYVRGRLGRFHLHGDQHLQPMKYLSGGQKSRVAFCVATWYKPHFLILDEPTNHLDLGTIDALANAVKNFHGGVVVISHDQYFLSKVADQFWAVTPECIRRFEEFENAKQFALHKRLAEVAEED